MRDHFDLNLRVAIRDATNDDARALEWDGINSVFRQIVERDLARALAGECVYLVAVLNAYLVGQVQIDLARHAANRTGLVWALRVLPALQGLGIGTRLIQAAEDVIRASGLPLAQLGVAKDNPRAQRLYERLGYVIVADDIECWSLTTPDGATREVEEAEWIMRKQLG